MKKNDYRLLVYFPTGIESIISEILHSFVKNAEVISTGKGEALISVGNKEAIDEICKLSIFNNVLLILGDKLVINDLAQEYIEGRAVRIISFKDRQTVSIDDNLLNDYEKVIRKSGCSISRSRPDYEVWMIKRSGRFNGVALRLTSHPDYHASEKSELRPEICFLMNYLSEPSSNDVWLDPFCGSGALAESRIKISNYKKIICSDIDISKIEKKRSELDEIEIKKMNYKDIHLLQKEGVNKVVTDPEWGIFNKDVNIEKMHDLFFYKVKRLIPETRIFILLTHKRNDDIVLNLIKNKKTSLNLISKLQIFVWNQPAYIYKFKQK